MSLTLADASPHALIGGPSGSGKTNLLLTLIASMAARYSPDELEFYLLDFKEGVSLRPVRAGPPRPDVAAARPPDRGQHQRRPRVRSRAAAVPVRGAAPARRGREGARGHEARGAARRRPGRALAADRRGDRRVPVPLRRARRGHPRGRPACWRTWPGAAARRASTWCWPARTCPGSRRSGAVRRSSSSSSLRIGLPRARRILAEANDATLGPAALARRVNHESGMRHGNEIARDSRRHRQGRGRTTCSSRLYAHFVDESADQSPPLFDGSRAPQVGPVDRRAAVVTGTAAIIGQRIDVDASPAAVPLPTSPGRNIGVVGTALKDAVAVLGAAAASLGAQHKQGDVRFVLAPLVIDADTGRRGARAEARRAQGRPWSGSSTSASGSRDSPRDPRPAGRRGPRPGLPRAVRRGRRRQRARTVRHGRPAHRAALRDRRPGCTRSAGGAARSG